MWKTLELRYFSSQSHPKFLKTETKTKTTDSDYFEITTVTRIPRNSCLWVN